MEAPRPADVRNMFHPLLYLAFRLPGAVGPVYEVVWSRYLALFVGHSAEAAVGVISLFLGGLSFGAWFTSRIGEGVEKPLRAYAFVELGIGEPYRPGYPGPRTIRPGLAPV